MGRSSSIERRLSCISLACILLAFFLSCSSSYVDRGTWNSERAKVDSVIIDLLETGRFDRALAICDSLISSGQKDPRVISQKARALAGLGRNVEAVPLFERAIVDDYENCENHLDFATCLMKLGKVGRAITEFKVALRFCPPVNRKVALKNLAVTSMKMKRLEEAEEYIDRAMEIGPSDAEVLALKGMFVSKRDPAMAESLFVRSLRKDSLQSLANYHYALLMLRSGRKREAVKLLERAVLNEPREDWLLTLVDAYIECGMNMNALKVLDGIKGAGDSSIVVRRRAKAFFNMGRFEDALNLLKSLPADAYTMDRIAMCYFKLGDVDEALAWERKALSENGRWTTGLINLSVMLASKGELEEAKSILEKALDIDPSDRVAAENLKRVEEAMKSKHRGD